MLKKKNLDPEKEAELQKEPKEKGDVPAMLLAAFLNLFLPAVIALIVGHAFGWEQALGGGVGMALMQGINSSDTILCAAEKCFSV